MIATKFPEFDGGPMPDSFPFGQRDYGRDIAHRQGPVPPDDCEFWSGCYHNSKGNLYTAAKRLAFSWTDGIDEPSFAWIVELHDGRFACVEGGHDYTGWDCQSSLEVCAVEATEGDAARFLTDDPRRAYAERSAA
jgi:hypothetical protein